MVAGRVGAGSDEAHYGPLGPSKMTDRFSTEAQNAVTAGLGDGKPTDLFRIGVQYEDPGDKGLFGGISFLWAKDKDFGGLGAFTYTAADGTVVNVPAGAGAITKNAGDDKAQVLALNLGYRFSEKAKFFITAGRNSKATSDTQKTSWSTEFRYGTYGDYAEKGDWAAWVGYSKFGWGTAIATDQGDDVATGEKGWHIGVAYAPFKNTGILLRYADAKDVDAGNVKDKHFWGRVEFFF